jgi:hypothetical protein
MACLRCQRHKAKVYGHWPLPLPGSKTGGVSRGKGKRNWRECVAVSDKKGAVRMEASNKPACHWSFERSPSGSMVPDAVGKALVRGWPKASLIPIRRLPIFFLSTIRAARSHGA